MHLPSARSLALAVTPHAAARSCAGAPTSAPRDGSCSRPPPPARRSRPPPPARLPHPPRCRRPSPRWTRQQSGATAATRACAAQRRRGKTREYAAWSVIREYAAWTRPTPARVRRAGRLGASYRPLAIHGGGRVPATHGRLGIPICPSRLRVSMSCDGPWQQPLTPPTLQPPRTLPALSPKTQAPPADFSHAHCP